MGLTSGSPEELFYADDSKLVSETLEGLQGKLEPRKEALEPKGLKANFNKTKMVIRSENAETVPGEGKFPCAACRNGVGSNSIPCHCC